MTETTVPKAPALLAISMVLMLAIVPLAGCIGGGGSSSEAQDTDDTTDDTPTADNLTNNSSYLNNTTVEIPDDQELDEESTFHVHDYWGDRTEYTLIEGKSVTFTVQEDSGRLARGQVPPKVVDVPIRTDSSGTPVAASDGKSGAVFPGTGKIELTLEWSSTTLEGASNNFKPTLCVVNWPANAQVNNLCTKQIAGPPDGHKGPNATFPFDSSGETKTIERETDYNGRVALNRKTIDEPHSVKSDWRFAIQPCRGSGAEAGCRTPNFGPGEVTYTLSAKIVRDSNVTLPRDPPHFAFYGERSEMTVLASHNPGAMSTPEAMAVGTYADLLTGEPKDPVFVIDSAYIRLKRDSGVDSETKVVPPGTKTVTLNMDISASWTPVVKYVSAADAWGQWNVLEGSGPWQIPVESGQDSLYATSTQWKFAVFVGGDKQNPPTPGTEGSIENVELVVKKGA